MKHTLSRIVSWSHELLAEVVPPGGLAVDLTAGNGHDTLILGELVGSAGQVVAFDIQEQALLATEQRLAEAGIAVHHCRERRFLDGDHGVSLVAASHAELDCYLETPANGIIANLGYLPGGDSQLITRPESTLVALEKACVLLAPAGRLAVVVYPGHPGGREEAEQVDLFFASLPEQEFEVLCLRVGNRPAAPYLQVAEKRSPGNRKY